MIVEWEGEHPAEGSIHAWLDGELEASEAAQLEAHVAACTACASRVAEARGLIAGASRVVGLLDETPAPLIRPASTPTASTGSSVWRMLRVTPARASIAAVLLVALGITLTRNRVAMESVVPSTATSASRLDKEVVSASAPTASPAPMKDGLLDSAIARRLASEHPVRKVEPVPGAAIPAPSASEVAASAAPDPSAATRVAAGKASIRAQSDSFGAPADRARVGFNAGAPVTAERLVVAGKAAEGAGSRDVLAARVAGGILASSSAGLCYRVESPTPGAQWGSATLPLVVAFDSTGTFARVLTANGGETDTRATLRRVGLDSLVLRLLRIGYEGSLALSGTGDTRSGVMHSNQVNATLSEVVVTGAAERVGKSASEARSKARSDAAPPQTQSAPGAPDAQPREARVPIRLVPAVAVTAHLVSCPKP
jgi:hypothetical protein